MRVLPNILSLFAAILIATGVFRGAYGYFQSEEFDKAEGRLFLYQSTVRSEFERFAHLAYVLSRDTYVIETAAGGATEPLNTRLEGFAAQAGLEAIYLMRPDGVTIAASNYRQAASFVGQNYSFRPYFQQALAGSLGRFYAIGTTTGLPGYFIAHAVYGADDQVLGVIAIKVGSSQLENSWRRSEEQLFLANEDGVVLLSSDPDLRYRVLHALQPEQRARIKATQQFPGEDLLVLDWTRLPGQRARIAGQERLYLTTSEMPNGWTLHYFAADDRAVARSWLVTAGLGFIAGCLFILFQIQQARRVGAALTRAEQEEAQLRLANERLAIEIGERNTAERRLKRTKEELERASRLAALGQLAASVTHELGQPIAAMRNHLTAAEMTPGKTTPVMRRIGDLVDRMEGITRQLKFFARSESEPFKDVSLNDAMQTALSLVAPNMEDGAVDLTVHLPDHPIWVRGNRLRIEQVMTNLLRNAADAVEDCTRPQIWVEVSGLHGQAWFEIRDNGHGLGAATLADLQEPFVTTRESGRGMGLGLAISASIVKDHGGQMTARNGKKSGAVFLVTFPPPETKEAGSP